MSCTTPRPLRSPQKGKTKKGKPKEKISAAPKGTVMQESVSLVGLALYLCWGSNKQNLWLQK